MRKVLDISLPLRNDFAVLTSIVLGRFLPLGQVGFSENVHSSFPCFLVDLICQLDEMTEVNNYTSVCSHMESCKAEIAARRNELEPCA